MRPTEYEIVIFPGTTRPRRFTLKRRTVGILLVTTILAAVLEVAFLVQYVARSGELWELEDLRSEAAQHRQQASMLSTGMEDLRKQLSTMRDINLRLRVMLGLDPPKPSSTGPGLGGKEESNAAPALDVGGERASFSEIATQLQQKIEWLHHEALTQQEHLQELNHIAGERRAQWAATPSIWPVRGWLSSRFGHRISPFTGMDTMHGGVDISAPMHTPVIAPAAGTVTFAGTEAGLGNVVIVSHGYGLKTTYGHLSKDRVKAGQTVKRGDILGEVGSTGLSTGPHLHYEVEVHGRPVDPTKYIID